jgi:hypothetical protein
MFPQAAGQHFHPRPDALRPPPSVLLKRKLHTASVSLPQVFDGEQLTGDVTAHNTIVYTEWCDKDSRLFCSHHGKFDT